jgi:protein-tyrosine sulfotransferase
MIRLKIGPTFFVLLATLNLLFMFHTMIYLSENSIEKKSSINDELTIHDVTAFNRRLFSIADSFLNQKLIFIIGEVSSGTTLLRYILDSHLQVNCGDETKIIHKLIQLVKDTFNDAASLSFMQNSGIKNETIQKATALFIYYMMEMNSKKHNTKISSDIKYLCNKEPINVYHMDFLKSIFPNSRFVFIVRDGRDLAVSYMIRNNINPVFEIFFKTLQYWNFSAKKGYESCIRMGTSHCKLVKYENLTNEPEKTLREIVTFLEIPWTNRLLHHYKYLGKSISLSKEPVFVNIQKRKINNASVGKWKSLFERKQDLFNSKIIPMLKILNYI